jgi:restriction system protein
MSALRAVEQLLQNEGKPLHYREITRLIIERGLWRSDGKTPAATVNALLAVDIKRRGAQSRFRRVGKGIFGLADWQPPEHHSPQLVVPPQTTSTRQRLMSFTDAAEYILDNYGNRQPMHYREVTGKILELRLVSTQGQTPEATVYAQILTEIQRSTKRGNAPRFVKHGKGLVGLRRWLGEGLAAQIKRHNDSVRKGYHEYLYKIAPAEFETLIAQLLVALGFEEVTVTRISGDGGIDVRGTLVVGEVIRTRMAIQVKRWKGNVQAPVVQQVRGSLGTHEQGLIITTSDFSKGAREEAERANATPVALMNGSQLVDVLIENDIGIRRTQHDLIELDPGDSKN